MSGASTLARVAKCALAASTVPARASTNLASVGCGIADSGVRIATTVLGWLHGGYAPPSEIRTPVELLVRSSSRATRF